ncbi:MAG: CRTAC1 family protein [Acidobacteriota bacterium]|nr:CRTAC1 family protein [Acidobacteriota bacterium]
MTAARLNCFVGTAVLLGCAWGFASPSNPIRFEDVAAKSGIHAQMRCGGPEKKWIPEANGSGAAWLDFDHDGLMDLLIVNGSTMDDLRLIVAGKVPPVREGSLYLYRNLGNGRFEDVTKQARLENPYWGTGVAVADFNNDGYPDILVTNIGVDLLFRNNGDGTFSEIGRQAGLSRKIAWHTGAAFGDYDGDGKLDLYVAGYVDLGTLHFDAQPPVCNYRGISGFCGPQGLKGEADILYHNEGHTRFVDVTEKAGVKDQGLYHGFSVVFGDFNQDGKIDIFVANDSDPNYLYLNRGNGVFEEAGLPSGVAFGGDGRTQSNMGVAAADFDNDGLIDLMTTTFSEDYFPLFKQQSPGLFEDVSAQVGLANSTTPWVGWACGFADLDNDGNKDLWMANGHVYPKADTLASTSYLQPIAIFANHGGKFVKVPEAPGGERKGSYRGGCAGDFNNDGKIDLLVLPIAGQPLLLENRTESHSHWLGIELQGKAGNRNGIGAQIRVEYCGKTQFEFVRNGGSYLSVDDPRIHFGLGSCPKVDRLSIRWPDGRRQVLQNLSPDRYLPVEEPF